MTKASLRYTVLLYPDEGVYSVVVPALPGCVTWGHTVDEALTMARDAIEPLEFEFQNTGDAATAMFFLKTTI